MAAVLAAHLTGQLGTIAGGNFVFAGVFIVRGIVLVFEWVWQNVAVEFGLKNQVESL